ncbi:MAG: hypothetical protein ACMG6E_01080 [Candidatus Roizmanbacteria bacterium]
MVNRAFVRSKNFYSFAEKLIPFFSLVIITFPFWLSPFHPAVSAYIILGYILYFSIKSIRTLYYTWISYTIFEQSIKISWWKSVKDEPRIGDLEHYLIITDYKELLTKVESSLECVKKQTFPLSQIHIVLAMELREGDPARERSAALTQKYEGVFGSFMTTYHDLVPGEAAGKASNEAHAAKEVYKVIGQKGLDLHNVIITVGDADSLFPDEYFACLSKKYLGDQDRQYHFYAAPVLLYNNFWKLPLPVRLQTIISSVMRISVLSQEKELIQISTYSASLWLIHNIGYWDVDIIPEDWHVFLQAFFTYGEKVKTIPIYLPIIGDPVLSDTLWKTFKSRYEQEKRWAWGASDIPYAIVKFFDTPHIPIIPKLRKVWYLVETHLLWPTSFFLLTVSGWIPALVNPAFKRTVLGFLLPQLSSVMLTATTLLLFLILYFDYKLRNHIKIKTDVKQVPLLFIQWYLLPVISLLFSSLPALEAHVRLLIGRKIEYKVTEKI